MTPTSICFPFVGDSVSGSHISALLLLEELSRRGWQPIIVVHQEGPLTTYLKSRKLSYNLLPLGRWASDASVLPVNLGRLWWNLWPLRSALRQNGLKLVHTHDTRTHWQWGVAARLAGCKHVWHQRSVWTPSPLGAGLGRLSGRIISMSRHVQSTLPPTLRRRSVVIANPVKAETGASHRQASCRQQLAGSLAAPFVVGIFGHLREGRQPLLATQAVLQAQQKLERPVVLAVFGQDQEKYLPRMEAMLRAAGVGVRLRAMGFQSEAQVWMSACDAVLACANVDSFGRTLVEAMLARTPVVATPSGGHGEIITDGYNGLLAHDAEGLGDALVRLAREPGLVEELQAAGQKQALHYAPDVIAGAVEDVYAKLL